MKDITEIISSYRECVRNLWNTYFIKMVINDAVHKWDIYDEFEEISTELFSSLVLNVIECAEYKKSHSYQHNLNVLTFLKIVPASDSGVPIQISRELAPSSYWDYPIKTIKPCDVEFGFIGFFDPSPLDIRDLEYFLVYILDAKNKDLVGRRALIQYKYAKVYYTNEIDNDDAIIVSKGRPPQ